MIIAETQDWLVVDKPAFLQVHPSKPSQTRTLWHHLRDLLAYELVCGGQISIVNRLDRETSGLTLVAKTRPAARAFGLSMERREFHKVYLALVWGWPEQESWEVDAPTLRQGDRQPSPIYLKQAVHAEGAAAHTRFRVVRRFTRPTTAGDRFALLRAEPHTGRMHQIRVHLSYSGFPIVGDKIYGPDQQCYLEFIDTGWTPSLARRLLLPRHALHAAALSLPSRGLHWEAPLPGDLAEFISPA